MCSKTVVCRRYQIFILIGTMEMPIYISTLLKLLDSTRTINAEAAEPTAPEADGICASLPLRREGDHDHVIGVSSRIRRA